MKPHIIIFLLSISGIVNAQVKAELKQLEFMTGTWHGSMEWGDMEEFWGAPMGDNMICSFRCVKDGKALFYEFILIEQSENGVPVMKLRHFDRGNIAWEEKDKPYEYPLTSLSAKKAIFESADKKTRLIYQRTAENKLLAILEREKDGKMEKDEFEYTKK